MAVSGFSIAKMALTSIQRRMLSIYQKYREQPMTVSGLIWSNRRTYAVIIVLFSAMGALLYALDPQAAKLAGFAFAAILLRTAAISASPPEPGRWSKK